MKPLLLFVLISGFLAGVSCPRRVRPVLTAAEDATERKEILAVIDKQKTAWNRADLEGFVQAYWHSPEVTFAGSSGITRGWEPLADRYREHYPNAEAMGQLDFSDLEVHSLGKDSAFVLGRWHLERRSETLGGVFTLIFEHLPEGWRIVHDHTSVDTNGG